MITFPEDKPRNPKPQPRYFFIFGEPMSGKTYFASFFPHAIDLNTDDNAEQSRVPSISLLKDENKKPVKDVIGRLDEIIKGLSKTTFKTVIIDTIEDVVGAIEKQITEESGEKYITDGKLAYGKGGSMARKILTDLVLELKALSMNVIWISREEQRGDITTNSYEPVPALKTKYFNIVNGNCDLVIRTKKVGQGQNISYFRTIESRRTNYEPENIVDERTLKLLASCNGMFTEEQIKRMNSKKENK